MKEKLYLRKFKYLDIGVIRNGISYNKTKEWDDSLKDCICNFCPEEFEKLTGIKLRVGQTREIKNIKITLAGK